MDSFVNQRIQRYVLNNKLKRKFTFVIWMMVVIVVLAACTGTVQTTSEQTTGSGSQITAANLPDGLGRGFPNANLNDIDNSETGVSEGNVAPNFQLQLADGRYVNLHDLQGQPVLINFWATWCGPCRLEMPDIVAESEANDDLIVLAVNAQETLEQIEPFVEEFQMSMPVVVDQPGEIRKLYQVRGMPTSVFIDREGNISTYWAGILNADLLNEFIEKIL